MRKLKEIETVWSGLGDIEKLAQETMRVELSPWEEIIKTCVEAGILTAVLPAKDHGDLPFIAAAPYLKRSLNDLRCIWLLIEKGYASQAARETLINATLPGFSILGISLLQFLSS